MLGGGQLGRMFALSARQSGYRVMVFGDPIDSPAGQVADAAVDASFLDHDALRAFAKQVDIVSYEQENIPVATIETLLPLVDVRPGIELLRASQNRLLEKSSLQAIGIRTAGFCRVASETDAVQSVARFGGDVILKTVTLGYDGKGQARVRSSDEAVAAWRRLQAPELIAEQVIDFDHELSIVASRFADGTCAFFAPVMNTHVNHILDLSVSPSPQIPPRVAGEAEQIARAILEHFDVIGVLCVEFFLTHDGTLLVNEIAPRPHNSGHLTINACRSSQFEQQLRAVCGLPSGDVRPLRPSAMANLLGDHLLHATADRWSRVFAMSDVHVHLYGKSEARVGRKMGHLTATAETADEAARRALLARRMLDVE